MVAFQESLGMFGNFSIYSNEDRKESSFPYYTLIIFLIAIEDNAINSKSSVWVLVEVNIVESKMCFALEAEMIIVFKA